MFELIERLNNREEELKIYENACKEE